MKFFKIFFIALLLLGITGSKLFSQIPAPNLIDPQNNAVGVSLLPYFDWTDVENATSYSLQLSTSADFEFLIINETGLTVSNYQTPQNIGLDEFVQYFWRASASIGEQISQWSEVWSFSTEYVPVIPVLLQPENGETNVPFSPEFVWQPFLNATGYHLQVSTDEEFSNIIIDEPNLTEASFLSSGLNFETQYWWRVLAFNPLISTPWSEVWTFTTGNSIIVGNGTSFNSTNTYPAPYGNAFSGSRQQFLILADEIIEAGGLPDFINYIGFNVQSTNNCGVLNDFQIKMKLTIANSITSFDNEDLFLYYSNSSYQPIVGWNNHSLDEPFNWDGVSNILIDICFNNYPSAPTANASTYYTETSFTSAIFDYSNENSNICNNNTNAFLSNFRPNILLSAEEITWPIIDLIDPINNAVNVSVTPTFVWNCTTSEYPYHIQVSANPDFSELIINEIVDVETYESSIELDSTTQYWWRVGIEDDGYYIWSDIWTFTTEPASLQINLNTGWNTISSNVVPESPEMPEVFSGISSNTILVKNGLGEIYSPVFGINNIGNWDISDGYLVYMNSSTSLNIFGTNVIPENTPINLVSGWNLVSYLRAAPMDAALAFSNILPYLVLAKNNNGYIFSPQYGLNNIGNLLTGQGYWLYMSAPAVLVYPSN